MTKARIRTITLLITLAASGILIFQINWLINSYGVSKEKLRQDISTILDDAILQHKRQRADSIRTLIKKLVRSEKDFRYEFFTYKSGVVIGYRNPEHNTIIDFPIPGADSNRVKKDPYAFLIDRIDEANLDKLRPLYSTLIGTRDYTENSADEKVAIELMHAFDLYKDTTTLNGILKWRIARADIPFTARVTYYSDLSKVYQKPLPAPAPIKNTSTRVIGMMMGTDREPLAMKLDNLNSYIKQLNTNGDSCYIAKPLLYDINDIIMDNIPVLVLSVNTPTMLVISKMRFNIIASYILLLCVGLCITYLLNTIIKQKKLADIKNDFISNISHELKTPVSTALAAVQGMQYFDVLKDPEKTTSYLATAADEIKRLALMINKIINVSIFESKDFKLNPTTFNFKEMLVEMAASQQIRQEKDIKINLDYQAREVVFADRQHLQNVMLNLIDNAINYSGSEVSINIQCINIADKLQVSISDNGIGIKPEHQKMIFDKFFRVPGAGSPATKSYGLGLSYVRQMVEKHGGSIVLANSGPGGSTFIINLPG